jgi:hypothetical protein
MASLSRAPFSTRSRLPFVVVPALLMGVLLSSSGCGNDARDKLKGRWVGERIDNIDEAQVPRPTRWAKATSFEFAGDKLTVTIPAEAPRSGSFKVAKLEGEKMVLAVTRADATLEDPTTLTMVDERTIRWDLGQTRELVLVRAQ